jgi:hypothetical protein
MSDETGADEPVEFENRFSSGESCSEHGTDRHKTM